MKRIICLKLLWVLLSVTAGDAQAGGCNVLAALGLGDSDIPQMHDGKSVWSTDPGPMPHRMSNAFLEEFPGYGTEDQPGTTRERAHAVYSFNASRATVETTAMLLWIRDRARYRADTALDYNVRADIRHLQKLADQKLNEIPMADREAAVALLGLGDYLGVIPGYAQTDADAEGQLSWEPDANVRVMAILNADLSDLSGDIGTALIAIQKFDPDPEVREAARKSHPRPDSK